MYNYFVIISIYKKTIMAVLNIYSLDDTEQQTVIASLSEGQHIIGRGGILNVTDKRVSRKHAIIEVSPDRVLLTSVHMNPCFFRSSNSRNLTVIKQSEANELNDGDQFALLPEDYWFTVKIKKEIVETDHRKRDNESVCDEPELKRPRLSANTNENPYESKVDGEGESSRNNETTCINNNTDTSQNKEESVDSAASINFYETARIEDLVEVEVKKEPEDNNAEKNEVSTSNNVNETSVGDANQALPGNSSMSDNDVKPVIKTENNGEENTVTSPNTGPPNNSSDTRRVRRERCWYGDRCFRKNPNHRDTFSHPGDQDYDSDPDDDRPDCPYGMACYRKNLDHRREYKHSARPAPKPTMNQSMASPPASPAHSSDTTDPTAKKKRQRKAPKKQAQADDSEDDYDLEDPFINDGSSDDFEPSDYGIDSSDSDLDDSQGANDEESQERKRMLKEAKKFTKKRK